MHLDTVYDIWMLCHYISTSCEGHLWASSARLSAIDKSDFMWFFGFGGFKFQLEKASKGQHHINWFMPSALRFRCGRWESPEVPLRLNQAKKSSRSQAYHIQNDRKHRFVTKAQSVLGCTPSRHINHAVQPGCCSSCSDLHEFKELNGAVQNCHQWIPLVIYECKAREPHSCSCHLCSCF